MINRARKEIAFILKKFGFRKSGIRNRYKDESLSKYLNKKYRITEKYNTHSKFLWNETELNKLGEILNDNELRNTIITRADLIMTNKLNILNEEKQFGNRIIWNDSFRKFRWKNMYYMNFNELLNKSQLKPPFYRTDIKFNWELNKLLFIEDLILADIISKNEKYLRKIEEILIDWEKENDCPYTVAWTANLIVAQRMITLIYIYQYLKESKKFRDEEFQDMLRRLIYVHLMYVVKHYEKGVKSTNHYIGNIASVILCTLSFPEFKNSRILLRDAKNRMTEELTTQFRNDNLQYEQSSGYYRYILEFLIISRQIMKRNNEMFSYALLDKRIHGLGRFIEQCKLPDGDAIIIGDFDSARVLQFTFFKPNSFKLYPELLNAIYNNGIINTSDKKTISEIFWWTGRIPNVCTDSKINGESHLISFKDSGFYFINKIMNGKKIKITFDNGDIGKDYNDDNPHGTHGHDDNMNFTISIGNEMHIVDPGTGTYTLDKKVHDQFRATYGHNCFICNNGSYSGLDDNFWTLNHRAKPIKTKIDSIGDSIHIKSSLNAYRYIKDDIFINREIFIDKERIKIKDSIKGIESETFTDILHFHPECRIEVNENKIVSIRENSMLILEIETLFDEIIHYKGNEHNYRGWFSRLYNHMEPASEIYIISGKKEFCTYNIYIGGRYEDK